MKSRSQLQARAILATELLSLLLAGHVTAQTFTILHSFSGGNDGSSPAAPLILSGDVLYGTTVIGGIGAGTVFAVKTDGTGFTNLHSFLGHNYNDGADPRAAVVLSSNTLFGTTQQGGSPGDVGTIFTLNTNGTGYAEPHIFSPLSSPNSLNTDGAYPTASLVLSSNTLYGTTSGGGTGGGGTVFAMNTNGTGFTALHYFTRTAGSGTNADGANPNAGVVLSDNTLYGTAQQGGDGGGGTVFAASLIPTAVTNAYGEPAFSYGFTNLHSFPATYGSMITNSDGTSPYAGLAIAGNTLYGTARQGGEWGNGTVFKLNTDGTGFTILHQFTALISNGNAPYNSDGAFPEGGLVVSGNTLYGTARAGGERGKGTVFCLNTDGTGFTTLYHFSGTFSDGGSPDAGLLLSGYTLYGTTGLGGSWGAGTVFSLSLLPQLSIASSGTNMILFWPTSFAGLDYTGFGLQSTTNPAAAAWNADFAPPVAVNGQNTITIPTSASQQFFRLSR